MYTPERTPSRGLSPAGRTPSSRSKPAAQWRDRDKALSERGTALREDTVLHREVSYSIGTRPAAAAGSVSRAGLSSSRENLRTRLVASPGGTEPLFDKLDQNHDGVLSREEFAAGFGVRAAGADSSPQPGEKPSRAQDLGKGISPIKDDLQLARSQDLQKDAEQPRSNLSGLAAQRDRLQREVREMRGAVADTRRELTNQQDVQRYQTTEMRNTLANLQSDTSEQRRQASAFKDRKGAADGDPQLSRKVDGVMAKVESQEQKFARLENDLGSACAAQRAQLAEALAQGRQLARGLEEEGARRAAGVAEIQQALQQDRKKDGALVGQLQQDLARATSAIQGQSSDWNELARTIKSEVSGLATAMKADRDARAVESSSQRVEIARMLDQARRANVCDTVESYMGPGSTECGQDMLSRAGAVAVRKMVDTTKALLHGLEEALILRAGFIAGIFHTWRCEATLWKVGRRYQEEFTQNQDEWEAHLQHHRATFEEDLRQAAEHHLSHKDRIQAQKAMILDSWAYGEAVSLVRESMRNWWNYTMQEQQNRRTAARIHESVLQWAEGQEKGTVHTCFMSWKHWTLAEGHKARSENTVEELQQKHADELAKVQKAAEKKIQEGYAKLQTAHKGAKKDLEVIISKWEKGNQKGLLAGAWRAFRQLIQAARRKARHSQAVQLQLHKFVEGGKRGVKHTCWMCWKNEISNSKSIQAERARFENLISGDRAERDYEHRKALDSHGQKVEAAKECVRLMVEKWGLGQLKGLEMEVFKVWANYALQASAASQKCAAVEMTLDKFLAGENKGTLQGCFVRWKDHSLHAAVVRKHEAALESETQKMRGYLEDVEKKHKAEIDFYKTEAQRRKDAAHKEREYLVLRWELGDRKGSLMQVFKTWSKAAKDCHRHGTQRAAVQKALLASFEGNNKANMQLTFLYWHGMTKEARQERRHEDVLSQERAHWQGVQSEMEKMHDQALRGVKDASEERRLKALATSEASVMKWMAGEKKGLLKSVVVDWKRLKDAVKSSKKKSMAVQASMNRFLEGERRSNLYMTFNSWRNMILAESRHLRRVDQLEKQVEGLIHRNEVKLAKYATMLGNEQGPVLVGWAFSMWREISQGIRHVEKEREREVQLEELRRQHDLQAARKKELEASTLEAFGLKDQRVLVLRIFEAWKVYFEKAKLDYQHRMNQMKIMTKFADHTIMKKFQKDAAALLASSFTEWHREAMVLKHERHQDELHRRLQDHSVYGTQLEQRVVSLEEQLMMAYRQIDHITETLQKELQTKEELTSELREAYDKMRKSAFTPGATPTTAGNTTGEGGAFTSWPSRPGSAQSRGSATRPARLSGASSKDALTNSAQKVDQDSHVQDSIYERAGFPASLGISQSADSIFRGSRASSPSRCDWDAAYSRMREEGIVRTENMGRS